MQAHVEQAHAEEGHPQHQRNRQGHHQARAQAEREEAHHQHDDHRLGQGVHELADGALHRLRLAGHLDQLHAHRQARLDTRRGGLEVAAEGNDVAPLGHGHAQPQGILPLKAEARRRRLDKSAGHSSDVADAELPAPRPDARLADRLDRIVGPAGTQVDALVAGLEIAPRGHRVLARQGVGHRLHVQPQGGQLGVRQLHVDALLLLADQIHLGHTGHPQQLGTDAVAFGLQLGIVEAIAGQGVDVAEDITELVIEEGPADASGQVALDVADLLAHLVEDLRHLLRRGRILGHEEHHRFAGARIAADGVHVGHFLQFFLDTIGELFLHLPRRGAGPVGAHHHHLEGEGRVFGLAEFLVRHHPHQGQGHDEVADQGLMAQGPFGEIEAHHAQLPAATAGAAAAMARRG